MIVGIRADKCDLFRSVERQYTVVFQQDEGFLRCFFRQCTMLRAEDVCFLLLGIHIFIWIFKQSQFVFQLKNPQAALVNQMLVHFTFFYETAEVCGVNGCHHINIQSCLKRFFRCIGGIFRASVGNGFQNGCKVRNQHAVKSHLAAQDIAHQPFVGARRNAVDRVK